MRFRNMKTGNLLTVEDKDAVAIMASSPNYEKVEETVATPSAPADSVSETGNKGGEENAQEAMEKAGSGRVIPSFRATPKNRTSTLPKRTAAISTRR